MTQSPFPSHLLGIRGLGTDHITAILDRAEEHVTHNRQADKKNPILQGRTLINLFFENSTRTRTSFELAGKRLGADVINMHVASSSVKKGETLVDTALTLNAMHPDFIVVRHQESGAVHMLAERVQCAVINAGDGCHEHPTQALLDALSIRRRCGRIKGLRIAICGDITHSRVARSNILLLTAMGAEVRVIAPPALMPSHPESLAEGLQTFTNMEAGLNDADIIMMLRLQNERINGECIASKREYYRFYGLGPDELAFAHKDAIIMHPGPINRGVEISSRLVDDIKRSLVLDQVEMGVAVRQAILELLAEQMH